MKTLNEVVALVGMTRRVIQEYEQYEPGGIAVRPTEKNERGQLLYNDSEIERLWQIRFYRELGYDKHQIRAIFADPGYNKYDAIASQIKSLERKRDELTDLITIAKQMNEIGLSPASYHSVFSDEPNLTYNGILSLANVSFNAFPFEEYLLYSVERSDSELDDLFDIVDTISDLQDSGEETSSASVQQQIKELQILLCRDVSDSIIVFGWSSIQFAPGSYFAEEIDSIWGDGTSHFIYDAIQTYCSITEGNSTDKLLIEGFANIVTLAKQKFSFKSDEVQHELSKVHSFFESLNNFPKHIQLRMLRKSGEVIGSQAMIDLMDKGRKHGIVWFVSKAIEFIA